MNRKLIKDLDTDENDDLSAVNMVTLKKFSNSTLLKDIDIQEKFNVKNSKQQSFQEMETNYDNLISYEDAKKAFLSKKETFPMETALNMGNQTISMNPIILGTISGAGVILKTAMELKNLQKKIENPNVAFTSYAKILVDSRNFLRGEEWEKEIYLLKLKTLDDMVIEMGLNWEKYLEKYKKEF